MICQYIDGEPEVFAYDYELDGKVIREFESTTHLKPCKTIAIRELDIDGLKICLCYNHAREVAKRMRIGGYDVIEKTI